MIEVSQDYLRALNRLVDDIFSVATYEKDWTWGRLAKEAGVAYTTVCRLGERETRLPQLRSIYRLAKAVGMDLQVVKHELKMRKAA